VGGKKIQAQRHTHKSRHCLFIKIKEKNSMKKEMALCKKERNRPGEGEYRRRRKEKREKNKEKEQARPPKTGRRDHDRAPRRNGVGDPKRIGGSFPMLLIVLALFIVSFVVFPTLRRRARDKRVPPRRLQEPPSTPTQPDTRYATKRPRKKGP
jgi:hypothetical protein